VGLQGVLQTQDHKFGGVANGNDYSTWDPEIDPLIPQHDGRGSLQQKAHNKAARRQRVGLSEVDKPLVAGVSRLLHRQKGVRLVESTRPALPGYLRPHSRLARRHPFRSYSLAAAD